MSTLDFDIAEYTIVYDNFFGSRKETFLRDEKNVIEISAGNEAESFLCLIDIIKNSELHNDTIIYLLEDDYIHIPDWCGLLVEGFYLPVHYLSLYNHPELYTFRNQTEVFKANKFFWRTMLFTTNTFICRKRTFLEDIEVHIQTSTNVGEYKCTSDYSKWSLLGNKGRKLVCPIPGAATHCIKDKLGYLIDWEDII
jgi:hypothetical protein